MLMSALDSNIKNLCVFLLLGVCILMLLAPLFSWKYQPSKSLTKRLLIALFLIPFFLYFLFDMFHTNDIQKNNILLLNFDKSTESILLSDSDNTEISNEYAFASDPINDESNNERKIIEERSNGNTYNVIPVTESVDKPDESERDVF